MVYRTYTIIALLLLGVACRGPEPEPPEAPPARIQSAFTKDGIAADTDGSFDGVTGIASMDGIDLTSGGGGTSVSDDFNRADEELAASSNWSINYASAGNDNNVSSNTLIGESGGFNSDYWSADAFADDQYSQMTANNDNDDGGPSVRANAGDDYFLDNFESEIRIHQYNGGSFDVVAAETNDYVASSVYRLEMSGTTLTAKEDGSTTSMPSGTDASISSGSPGVFIYDNTLVFDNWSGGDL